MKTDIFPINYFNSVLTPIKAFVNRHKLSWPNMIVVLIFLNALMTIPITINFAQMDSFPLGDLYPNVEKIVEEQPLDVFNEADYADGEMIIQEPFVFDNAAGYIAGGVGDEKEALMEEAEHLILFEQNQFVLIEEGAPTTTVPYTEDFSLAGTASSEEVMEELGRQWFVQNQVFFVAFFTFLLSVLIFVMMLFLVFGSAVFLFLTKNSPITSITTYKESVNLILNLLTLPTVASLILGLVYFDIVWMTMLQMVGLIGMLLYVYYKTQFNDDKLKPQNLEDQV